VQQLDLKTDNQLVNCWVDGRVELMGRRLAVQKVDKLAVGMVDLREP
jgi:hypothetical protein